MAADATTYLLQSLGLRVRAPSADADPRRARGVKRSVILGKSWELRVKGWRHGARQKKDDFGNFLYREAFDPITMRWDNDEAFRESCSQESRKEFNCEFTREMALQADEIARHEEIASAARAKAHAMPSYQRQEQFSNVPLVRSTQAGGSGTRRRAGTEDEARAYAAVKGKGRGRSTGKGKGRGKGATWDV